MGKPSGQSGQEVVKSGEAVCIACGAKVERSRARCLECGAPQRRLKVLGHRLPAGPVLAVLLVSVLMVAALAVMMIGDRKAGPSRAVDDLRNAATGGRCEEVWELLTDSGQRAYSGSSDACRVAVGFEWRGTDVASIRVDDDDAAFVCVSPPPGYGIYLRKMEGSWRVETAAPVLQSECLSDAADPVGQGST